MFVEGRSEDDTRQKLMYDLYYIKHWNLWLEIKIIFKTIMVVVGKKGI
jgi:lipopolysaccharide/colanic/teichoic acid biosynthesis glycosyltransferase